MNKKILCKDVMSHICQTLGEDFNSPKCLEIKKHLAACPECIKYFKSIEKTIEFYKTYDCELSADAHKRLMETLGLDDTFT
jgi:hypothetical protein